MTLTAWLAVAVIILTVAALLKKMEVRTTLLAAGIFLCLVSMTPMAAFDQFAKMMTSATLVQSITAAMGFAFLMSYTKCDLHLVTLLAAPLKHLGLFLIPACTIVTLIVNTAIPSAAG
ncbi:MAG TPA: C4-dicarboxylate transporter DcuC, partial [Candidatus Aphodousia gallistercoris]|nr:C4-dicarboxylate transporter DcuC [Candidatus Aphodousia gallistercoris]